MGSDRDDAVRRSVVPPAAGRSLWLAAVWTGAGAAFVSAVLAIVAVAVCWLPAAGSSAHAESAIRAGLLTFLAALHGGITVGGVHAAFVPLGLTVAVALIAWRAGSGLADAADELDEWEPPRLARAAGLQAFTFAIVCGVMAAMSSLGTSHASSLTTLVAAAVVWTVTGSAAFVRASPLSDEIADRSPRWLGATLRIGVVCVAVYLIGGAVLVAGSLAVHHAAVAALSGDIGGGWASIPVVLLGVLAAPNAAVAAAGYLAGPGFAVGSGTTVVIGTTAHGTVPAFPILGALPATSTTPATVWALIVLTPIAAAWCAVALACRADEPPQRWRDLGLGAAVAAVLAAVGAWLGGGSIGDGHLATIGVSPWLFGVALGGAVAVLGSLALAAVLGVERVRGRRRDGLPGERKLKLLYESLTADGPSAGRSNDAPDNDVRDDEVPDDGRAGELAG